MKTLLIILLTLMITGCVTSSGTFARDKAVNKTADVYDETLINAELWVCRGSSVASAFRRYARTRETWEAYLLLCGYTTSSQIKRPLVTPPE
jgi:hypothetical protein